jgi:hypothetical protein
VTDSNPFPRFTFLWDMSKGNTKSVGRVYVTWRKGRGRGFPLQQTWLNESERPYRYGRGVGVRLPRRMLSIGLWSRVTALDYQPKDFAANIGDWKSIDDVLAGT